MLPHERRIQKMKVLHVPYCFAPDPVGGTEIYVSGLAQELKKLGVEPIIAAPSDVNDSYFIEGLPVRRYAMGPIKDVSELYGNGNEQAAIEFATILDAEQPDIVHLHAYTAGVSLRTVRAAKSRSIPVLFTYHTPTVTCQRGTLMLWGKEICDGRIQVARCAGCSLNEKGIPRPVSDLAGLLPSALGASIAAAGLKGPIWTALRTTELLSIRKQAFESMISEVDHVVAVCEWVSQLLQANNVPLEKLSLCRQGIISASVERESYTTADEIARIAFLGRLDPTKGVHVVIEALAQLPAAKIKFDVYGVAQSDAAIAYLDKLRSLARQDPRIAFFGAVEHGKIIARLRQYDFVAIPSQWMETGPLVALEAFAAGVPVLGWDMGGVRELVHHGVDGLLIDPALAISGWVDALKLISNDHMLRNKLKAGIKPPRSSASVAREMLLLYRALIEKAPRQRISPMEKPT
jgi:glycosyltransferase involved in cell wall biosynthesis